MLIVMTFLILMGPFKKIDAMDTPNDAGKSITLKWKLTVPTEEIRGINVYRAERREGPFKLVKFVPRRLDYFNDKVEKDRTPYFYKLGLILATGEEKLSEIIGPVESSPQVFHKGRIFLFIFVIAFTASVLLFIHNARRGRTFFLRPIPGLQAVDDAVGRATEMGKPILFLTGLHDITDIVTIAALNVLSHITKKAAEYETRIINPHYYPMTYTVAQQIVKEAYYSVGRPDLYDPNSVFYVTDRQFAFAGAVSGIMVREKPAANFFMGYYYAESLILAETGATTGAIQIAGTDAIVQLPFFITACDYTLIGEELYAASAYLSKEPVLTATIKSQDLFKFIIGLFLVGGTLLGFFGVKFIINLF